MPRFLLLLALALILDTGFNLYRHKKPVCAVSAAVTAAMLYVLTPFVPLWGQILGVILGLLLSKHLWGGTGKNAFNPALMGFVLLSFLWPVKLPLFDVSLWLLPALILSLFLVRYRPYAALGFLSGQLLWMLITQQFAIEIFMGYGIIFWACLAATDPVTVTLHPVYGGFAGLAGGFLPLWIHASPAAPVYGILMLNGVSAGLKAFGITLPAFTHRRLKIKKAVPVPGQGDFMDLTKKGVTPPSGSISLSADTIFDRIKRHEVAGLGGGGYVTWRKILMAKEADISDRHLIINGVECDPGLIHDHWLLKYHPNEMWRGITLLMKIMDFSSITLAVKQFPDKMPPKPVRVKPILDYFPAGAEKHLIAEILGHNLAADEIPAAAGILVLNLQTVYAVFEAVMKNRRADTRLITVADLNAKTCRVVRIRYGMRIKEIMQAVYPNASQAYWGGGLMQARRASVEDIADQGVNFIAAADHPRYKESRLCSNCGQCTIYCPSRLSVNTMTDLVDQEAFERALSYHPERCIQCGSCSYVCMAGRNLASRLKTLKAYTTKIKSSNMEGKTAKLFTGRIADV